VARVPLEWPADRGRVRPMAPVPGDRLRVETKPRSHPPPEHREVTRLEAKHAVAGRERVDKRGFPGVSSGPR